MTQTLIGTKRAVAYTRVSTRPQAGERSTSLTEQREHVERYCAEQGLRLVGDPYVDVMTGRKDARVHYQRMVADVLRGAADVIVVQWLDRFGRNPREILRRVWALQEANVEVVATDEDIHEELVLLLKAGIAGQESKRTSERIVEKQMKAAQRGTHFGRAPYGYQRKAKIDPEDPEQKRLIVWYEPEPSEAAAVREMYRLYVRDNMGPKTIARWLDDHGYKPRSAGGWSATTVAGVLASPSLHGTLRYNHRSQLVTVDDVFSPPILTADEAEALSRRSAIRRENPRGRTASSDYLLSGTARCGTCGGPMGGKESWNKLADGTYARYRTYVCSRHARSRALCPTLNSHAAHKLEQAVLDYLGQYSDPQRVRELLAANTVARREESELQRVEQALAEIDRDLQRDYDRMNRGVLDEDDFARVNKERKERRQGLEQTREELRERAATTAQQDAAIDALPARVRSFLDEVERLNVQQAKALLQTILLAAHVSRDNIELEFRT